MSTENQALELLKYFEELTRQFAPDVIDIAANVVWVSAINSIVFGGFVAIVLAIVITKVAWYATGIYQKKYEQDAFLEKDAANLITWIIAGIFIFGFAFMAILNLFDLWNWVALFKPHLALAHKILGL